MRVGDAVLADRADEHADELAVTPAAHDEEIGALRGLDEGRCRMAADRARSTELRVIGPEAGNCGVEHRAHV